MLAVKFWLSAVLSCSFPHRYSVRKCQKISKAVFLGVTILGFDDLPSRMAGQSSAMYAQNMQNLFDHISGKEKAKTLLGPLFFIV